MAAKDLEFEIKKPLYEMLLNCQHGDVFQFSEGGAGAPPPEVFYVHKNFLYYENGQDLTLNIKLSKTKP